MSGEAFSFIERADVPVFILSRNFSIYGIVAKLRLLGIAGVGSATAQALTWAYTALVLWLAWKVGRAGTLDRRWQVTVWIGLLSLASLRSPVAPSAYVTAPFLWLLALLAADVRGRYTMALAVGVAWAVIMGPPPLPDRIDVFAGLLGQAIALALGVRVLLGVHPTVSKKPASAMQPTPD